MTKKILVIEDEKATRNNIVKFLETEGFSTLVAENGRIGIELAQAHLPDLIICDILMPELDGYDVLTRLQQQHQTASIPFIFLTVTATESGLQQSLELGADDYLSKPITSEQLRHAIAMQLKKRESDAPEYTQPYALKSVDGESKPVSSQQLHLQQLELQQFGSQQTELLQFIKAKDRLFQHLSSGLRQHLTKMTRTIQAIKQKSSERETECQLNELQQVSARVLVLVNEVTALHNVLTPENMETLLEQFNFTDESDVLK